MQIGWDTEFTLLMDLRAECQLVSARMNAFQFRDAATEYNRRLKARCEASDTTFVEKHPRAVMEKLCSIDKIVLERIASKNYKCEWFL